MEAGDHRTSGRRILATLAGGAALIASLLAAAAVERPSGTERRGGRVVIGVSGDVSSFNIYTATNAFSQEVDDLLFLKLADEQDDFKEGPPTFRPSLAKSWEPSPDGTLLPFLLKKYERGSLIELARNPRYMRAPLPNLDSVVFRIIPDETSLVNELLSGGVDVMENVPAVAVRRIEADPRLRLVRVPDLSYH